jgi:hypothetical protein
VRQFMPENVLRLMGVNRNIFDSDIKNPQLSMAGSGLADESSNLQVTIEP